MDSVQNQKMLTFFLVPLFDPSPSGVDASPLSLSAIDSNDVSVGRYLYSKVSCVRMHDIHKQLKTDIDAETCVLNRRFCVPRVEFILVNIMFL